MKASPDDGSEALVVADVRAWRAWLDVNEGTADGVWLLLAKRGTVAPTTLTYVEALDEALCSGWIDGQRKGHDTATFRQRFTPRRERSLWSQRNVEHVARLVAQDRMRARGQFEIDRAKADGRWDRAYASASTAPIPDDLASALRAVPEAQQRFDSLRGQARYHVLHQLMTAPNEATRARRLDRLLASLAHPDDPGSAG